MLKHRLTLFLLAITFLAGASLPAAATDAWRASVPFDFVVQGVTYPAGNYEIVKTTSQRVVIVRSETNLKRSFLMVLPMGESLVSGNARLQLAPKPPVALNVALKGGGQK